MSRKTDPKSQFLTWWRRLLGSGNERAPVALLVAIAVPVAVSAVLLPPPMVLPVLSLWSLAGAALIGLVAWLRPRRERPDQISAWDIAGAFTLIGCAAAIVGEIEHMVEYMWSLKSRSEAHD